MARKSKPLIWAEYVGARGAAAVLRALPTPAAAALARGLGWLAYYAIGRRRRDGLRNLDLAYGDARSPAEKRRLVRRVFQHLAQVAVEIVKLDQVLRPDNLDAFIEMEDWGLIEKAAALGRGVIFVTGHVGNWELLGQAIAMKGYEVTSIARPLDNPLLENLVKERRERYGQKIVSKNEALRPMLKVLKEGRTLSFLIDQNARHGHVFVDFFGRPAATTRAAAALALRNQTPILMGAAVRVGPTFHYKILADGPIVPESTGDKEEDVRRLTQEMTSWLERVIREYPEQWLWLHRRWKTRPPEEAESAGP